MQLWNVSCYQYFFFVFNSRNYGKYQNESKSYTVLRKFHEKGTLNSFENHCKSRIYRNAMMKRRGWFIRKRYSSIIFFVNRIRNSLKNTTSAQGILIMQSQKRQRFLIQLSLGAQETTAKFKHRLARIQHLRNHFQRCKQLVCKCLISSQTAH